MGANLITKAEYKAYVGITSTNEDGIIDSLIPKVSEFVKSYCRSTFVDNIDEPLTRIFDGDGDAYLRIKESPLINVSLVEYSSNYGVTWTPFTEYTDYVVDYQNGRVRSLATTGFTTLINGYRVTFTYGWAEGIPADLKLAICDLITYHRKNSMAVHNSRNPGSSSAIIEYVTEIKLPSVIARTLDYYKAHLL